jgi:G3E family GTPase
MQPIPLIPISIITGATDSGKTIVLNQLLKETNLSDTLVIYSESDLSNIHHPLVVFSLEESQISETTFCKCCNLRSDLQKTLRDVIWRFAREGKRIFNRVIIETKGLADPAAIIHTLITDDFIQAHYQLDSIVTVINPANGMKMLDQSPELIKQVAFANNIAISYPEPANTNQPDDLLNRLNGINPAASIIQLMQPADIQKLNIFSQNTQKPENKLAKTLNWLESLSKPLIADKQGDGIQTFVFFIEKPVEKSLLNDWLDLLLNIKGTDIWQLSGVVNFVGETRPTIINATQHIMQPHQTYSAWPTEDHRTKIGFISNGIGFEVIEQTFNAMSVTRK